MIDTEFMIKYTNGLYATEPENAPRYDEFRDMFSRGQLLSKEWLVKTLPYLGHTSIAIAGSWFGTLGAMLLSENKDVNITFLDIDPRCEIYLKNIFWDEPRANIITTDMFKYKYTEECVINTSCEHISDLRKWLDILPPKTVVALQSNNYDVLPEHINCVFSQEEFQQKASLNKIFYTGELDAGPFTRYMLIGTT